MNQNSLQSPESQFPPGSVHQSIIKSHGLLDEYTALNLWEGILEAIENGAPRVQVDLQAAGPVLASGVYELQRGWRKHRGQLKVAVYFENLDQTATETFQMYGVAVRKGRVLWDYKAPARSHSGEARVRCPSCQRRLRIRRAGRFACPACQTVFQATVPRG